jgi:hypothetical protein
VGGDREEQMELKDFKEFIRNKRRNEFLKLKQTQKYADNPQGYDEMYVDVNDEVMSGLQERRTIWSPSLHRDSDESIGTFLRTDDDR